MISARYQQFFQEQMAQKTVLGQIIRRIRRFYLGTFRQDYVQKAIAETREGECHRCGACCELIYRCPFLGRDAQNLPYCRVYGDLRPANCRNYPFDEVDSEIDQCGYRFKKLGSPEDARRLRVTASASMAQN